LDQRIRQRVREQVDKNQQEYYLKEQLRAIQKELGQDIASEAQELRDRVAAKGMPSDVEAKVLKEVTKLERMPANNAEVGVLRNYIDWMLTLPWKDRTEDHLDTREVERVLNEDHYGLVKVKDRIVDFLAVRQLRAMQAHKQVVAEGEAETSEEAQRARTRAINRGPILCLIGPPGVGKTSLGESIARAMGRKFVRISLGGVHDEAEIRGHRRTYVGALPGRIVRALKEAGTKNPVIMLDEIDKVGSDWRGDPSAALLEVLDPAQNSTFRDHYLEVDLDLSEVLFIPTANVWETIPAPLLDRMELIKLDGYTSDEKLAIARDHLLPRQTELAGLREGEMTVESDAVLDIIGGYTREAGVRGLERELGKLARKVATGFAKGTATPPVTVTRGEVRTYLGRPRFDDEVAARTAVPGVATGLAVTGTGGDVLFIEAAAASDNGDLLLTGQLGDVMKESAQIALSYVRSHAAELGITAEAAGRGFHIHVPEGAVPKDGPSAGVTMTTAIVSLLTGRAVRGTVGMTGEVTLQGLVLPIGGVKQKVLAAHRMGLREVVLPRRNEKDIDDVPESVRSQMLFHFAGSVPEVLAAALDPAEAEHKAA
ncbi:MAG: endopeptidase La, partial [Candidatus Dormibacteraeota bacterium]|nr:endopeptidase La [Candidatus Dormibacteraeota bacterium]